MSELSPTAQAVLDAMHEIMLDISIAELAIVAAALRAAADQVVPKCERPCFVGEVDHADWFARDDVRDDLLRIADELENHQ